MVIWLNFGVFCGKKKSSEGRRRGKIYVTWGFETDDDVINNSEIADRPQISHNHEGNEDKLAACAFVKEYLNATLTLADANPVKLLSEMVASVPDDVLAFLPSTEYLYKRVTAVRPKVAKTCCCCCWWCL